MTQESPKGKHIGMGLGDSRRRVGVEEDRVALGGAGGGASKAPAGQEVHGRELRRGAEGHPVSRHHESVAMVEPKRYRREVGERKANGSGGIACSPTQTGGATGKSEAERAGGVSEEEAGKPHASRGGAALQLSARQVGQRTDGRRIRREARVSPKSIGKSQGSEIVAPRTVWSPRITRIPRTRPSDDAQNSI
jgi:hypothetical protein